MRVGRGEVAAAIPSGPLPAGAALLAPASAGAGPAPPVAVDEAR